MCIENHPRQSVSAETLGVEVSPATIPRNIRKALRNTEHREETLRLDLYRKTGRADINRGFSEFISIISRNRYETLPRLNGAIVNLFPIDLGELVRSRIRTLQSTLVNI